VWAVPLQQFLYRQVLSIAVIRSIAAALLGVRLRWNSVARLGNLTPGAGAPRLAAETGEGAPGEGSSTEAGFVRARG
jgi:hypothetical protein